MKWLFLKNSRKDIAIQNILNNLFFLYFSDYKSDIRTSLGRGFFKLKLSWFDCPDVKNLPAMQETWV